MLCWSNGLGVTVALKPDELLDDLAQSALPGTMDHQPPHDVVRHNSLHLVLAYMYTDTQPQTRTR